MFFHEYGWTPGTVHPSQLWWSFCHDDCWQIYYELGEIWMTIMDWRLEQAGVESKNPDMKLVAKGNRALVFLSPVFSVV